MMAGLAHIPLDSQKRTVDSPALPPGNVVIATINRLQGNTGVHTHTAALCDGLRAEGVDCNVVTPFDNGSHWLAVFAIRPLVLDRFWPSQSIHWYRHWHGVALRASLRRYLTTHQVSHIIAQCPVSAAASVAVREELGQSATLKVSLVCHFNHSEAHEYRVLGQLHNEDDYGRMLEDEANVLQSVDQVVYVSQWIRDVVERDRKIAPRASAVVHNGIESHEDIGSGVLRADLGAEPQDLLLINVGTLEARKNQVGLLELFAKVLAVEPRARLLLVGDGPDRSSIENRAKSFGISDRVNMLGRRTDVPSLMRLADLYVHYSTAENCPIVILEAARAALPWAAIPTAGIQELQAQIGGCIALDADDTIASAKTVAALLADASRRARLGKVAHESFIQGFTRRTMVQSYMNLLTSSRFKESPAEVNA